MSPKTHVDPARKKQSMAIADCFIFITLLRP
jgi:hypothetical protein